MRELRIDAILCPVRKWTCVIREARLWMATAAIISCQSTNVQCKRRQMYELKNKVYPNQTKLLYCRSRHRSQQSGYCRITLKMYDEYSDVFMGIECFNLRHFSQIIDRKPYQILQRHAAYVLQEPFKKELERLHDNQVLAPLEVDKMVKWSNSIIIVHKPNSTVCLGLDSTWCNQALMRPVHRGPALNDIFPKLTNVCYVTISDASSGYHNLKLDFEKSPYWTTFTCQFSRNRFTRLPFGMVSAGNMLQQKINEIFKDLPNVSGIADEILINSIMWVAEIIMELLNK